MSEPKVFIKKSGPELFRERIGPASAIMVERVPPSARHKFDFVEKQKGRKWATFFLTGQNQIGGFKSRRSYPEGDYSVHY
jgi:hypothetical protein